MTKHLIRAGRAESTAGPSTSAHGGNRGYWAGCFVIELTRADDEGERQTLRREPCSRSCLRRQPSPACVRLTDIGNRLVVLRNLPKGGRQTKDHEQGPLVSSRGGAASDWAEEQGICSEPHQHCGCDHMEKIVGTRTTEHKQLRQAMPGFTCPRPRFAYFSSYPRQRPYSLRCTPGTTVHRASRSCYVPHRLRTGFASC